MMQFFLLDFHVETVSRIIESVELLSEQVCSGRINKRYSGLSILLLQSLGVMTGLDRVAKQRRNGRGRKRRINRAAERRLQPYRCILEGEARRRRCQIVEPSFKLSFRCLSFPQATPAVTLKIFRIFSYVAGISNAQNYPRIYGDYLFSFFSPRVNLTFVYSKSTNIVE